MQKIIIEAGGKNTRYFRDLWNYRTLAFNFAKRDITVRYKQTAIGIGWALIGPLLNMAVMSFIFGKLAGLPADGGAPYSIMVYSGLIAWNLFARTLTVSAATFSSNADLMKKVYFPRLAAPLGQTAAILADSLISLLLLFLLYALTGYKPPYSRLIFCLPALLLPFLLGFFAGIFLAPSTIRRRDLNHALPFLLQVGQYLSPVVYSFSLISTGFSGKAFWLYTLNPMTGAINTFKWCLIGDLDFHLPSFLISLAWIGLLIPLGLSRFRKAEKDFVDLV